MVLFKLLFQLPTKAQRQREISNTKKRPQPAASGARATKLTNLLKKNSEEPECYVITGRLIRI